MSIIIDAHVLHAYPLSNLNRDEFGSPKIAFWGGVERSRVSSACIKRGNRKKVEAVLGDKALRTRRVPGEVAGELQRRGWNGEEATEAGQAVALAAGVKGLAIAEAGTTTVMLYLPEAGISALADLVEANRETIAAAAKQARAEAEAEASKGAGKKKAPKLDKETARQVKAVQAEVRQVLASRNASIAAFGRMLANTPEVTVDGAIAVAPAVTTHATEEQGDFFTAVDDITGSDNGSAHMGHHAYTSGTFYGYASIDVGEAAHRPSRRRRSRPRVRARLPRRIRCARPQRQEEQHRALHPAGLGALHRPHRPARQPRRCLRSTRRRR